MMLNIARVTGAFAIWSGVLAVATFAGGLINAWQAGRLVQVNNGHSYDPTNWDSAISVSLIFAACGVGWSYLALILWLVSLANPGLINAAQSITHGAGWYLPVVIITAEGLATFLVTRYALEVPAPYMPLAESGGFRARHPGGHSSGAGAGDVDASAAAIAVLIVLVVMALSVAAVTVWLVIRAKSGRSGIPLGFRQAFGFGYFRPPLASGSLNP
jgi:hypothetical protein